MNAGPWTVITSFVLLGAISAPTEAQTPQGSSPVIRIENLRSVPPNSAGGVEVRLAWRNLSPTKTVKYATFEVVPYNAVDDSVESEIGGKILARLEDVGPVAPGKWSGVADGDSETASRFDTVDWENVWYNSTIVRVELRRVRIEYMDGSKVTIQGNALRDVLHCVEQEALFDEPQRGLCDRAARIN